MKAPNFINDSPKAIRKASHFRPHPGAVLKRRFIERNKLNLDSIGMSKSCLKALLNEALSVDVNIAEKLADWTQLSANTWLYYQEQFDLYKSTTQSF